LDDHVGDAEVALQRALRDSTFWTFSKLMVVSWMVRMPRLMPQAAIGEHVPRGVVAQVDADVGDDVGQEHQCEEGSASTTPRIGTATDTAIHARPAGRRPGISATQNRNLRYRR
jgi:hypothetical protein